MNREVAVVLKKPKTRDTEKPKDKNENVSHRFYVFTLFFICIFASRFSATPLSPRSRIA